MQSKKEATRQRILETAAKIISRDGFEALGVADVMKQAGLTHGGFYAHFPNRDALVAEALDYARKSSANTIALAVVQQLEQGAKPLTAYIEAYLSDAHVQASFQGEGCPVAALGSEFSRQENAIKTEAVKASQAFIEKLIALSDQKLTRANAFVLAGSLIGTLQLARSLKDQGDITGYLAATKHHLLSTFSL
ncbi:MAG: TetR/AcrR family transcriptional regulator [Cellvibrio sp.]|uniref:TetR/AcrR family transcriptional regulator n=1 Tax=Cellvibrio sp. TaxID=1965322 RepID=UPI0031B29934